jgi:hypothetical protein
MSPETAAILIAESPGSKKGSTVRASRPHGMVNGGGLFRKRSEDSQYPASGFTKQMHKSHIGLGNVALSTFGF